MKTKNAAYTKITAQRLNEGFDAAVENAKQEVIEAIKKCLPKGWVPCTPVTYKQGEAGDDFLYNMFTVMGQRFVTRAPRIVAHRHYRKNNYRKFGSIKRLY